MVILGMDGTGLRPLVITGRGQKHIISVTAVKVVAGGKILQLQSAPFELFKGIRILPVTKFALHCKRCSRQVFICFNFRMEILFFAVTFIPNRSFYISVNLCGENVPS